jgi:hypothetical protein
VARRAALSEGKSLRKTITIVTALLTAFMALAALAGCAGDEKKAREYIEDARDKGRIVAQNQDKLQKQGEVLNSFAGSVKTLTPEAVSVIQKLLADLFTMVEATNKAAQDTRVEYKKILDLNGLDKYKRYARNRLKTLGLVDRRAKLARDFAATYDAALKTFLSGQVIDEAAVVNSLTPITEERDRLTKEIEKLNEEAVDLADELEFQ